jgi:hypothetical protein
VSIAGAAIVNPRPTPRPDPWYLPRAAAAHVSDCRQFVRDNSAAKAGPGREQDLTHCRSFWVFVFVYRVDHCSHPYELSLTVAHMALRYLQLGFGPVAHAAPRHALEGHLETMSTSLDIWKIHLIRIESVIGTEPQAATTSGGLSATADEVWKLRDGRTAADAEPAMRD